MSRNNFFLVKKKI